MQFTEDGTTLFCGKVATLQIFCWVHAVVHAVVRVVVYGSVGTILQPCGCVWYLWGQPDKNHTNRTKTELWLQRYHMLPHATCFRNDCAWWSVPQIWENKVSNIFKDIIEGFGPLMIRVYVHLNLHRTQWLLLGRTNNKVDRSLIFCFGPSWVFGLCGNVR